LFNELQRRGYRGSYATLAHYTRRLRQAQASRAFGSPSQKPTLPSVIDGPKRSLTPRSAAWLVLRRAQNRDAEDTERLNRLRLQPGAMAEAIALAEEFAALVRTRDPERLDVWLARAQGSTLPAFQDFAQRLKTDHAAVQAAVRLPWSTGPVEGQINRLKMLKRQMYGRANLDLLNRRFLFAA
jgi:transposase